MRLQRRSQDDSEKYEYRASVDVTLSATHVVAAVAVAAVAVAAAVVANTQNMRIRVPEQIQG